MPKCDFSKVANKLNKATLLKSQFDMGDLLEICCLFSEHLFLRTPLEGFSVYLKLHHCRFEKLSISSSSHENSVPEILY